LTSPPLESPPGSSGPPRRPRSSPPVPCPSTSLDINNLENNNIYNYDYIGENSNINEDDIDLKDKLTLQEIKFLEIYFSTPYSPKKGHITIENAMIAAWYTNIGQREKYRIAAKIVKKADRPGSLLRGRTSGVQKG
jgi:hypothetical protein